MSKELHDLIDNYAYKVIAYSKCRNEKTFEELRESRKALASLYQMHRNEQYRDKAI